MGRNHPLGIVLAAVLFGALYQGGSELSFDMPAINRDMVVVIQGLVILFCRRAGEHAAPARCASSLARGRGSKRRRDGLGLDRPAHLPARQHGPARRRRWCCAALAGLFSERSGVIDIGLEGKMLGGAFAAAAAAAVTGSAWLGLLAAILLSLALSLVTASPCITQRGNQVVSGMALNIVVAGLGPTLANAWFHQAGRVPITGPASRFLPDRPAARHRHRHGAGARAVLRAT